VVYPYALTLLSLYTELRKDTSLRPKRFEPSEVRDIINLRENVSKEHPMIDFQELQKRHRELKRINEILKNVCEAEVKYGIKEEKRLVKEVNFGQYELTFHSIDDSEKNLDNLETLMEFHYGFK